MTTQPITETLYTPEQSLTTSALRPVAELALRHADAAEQDPQAVIVEIDSAISTFSETIERTPIIDAKEADRATSIDFQRVEPELHRRGEWLPRSVYAYSTNDPWQSLNPVAHRVTTDMINTFVDKLTDQTDPTLAYLDSKRSSGGRRMTEPTKLLADSDDGIQDWIKGLPQAPMLRPVAHPWHDTPLLKYNEATQTINETYCSDKLLALVGSAGDGRAVREREAWVKAVLPGLLPETLQNDTLTITSLGTGTGEPAMDTGIEVVRSLSAEGGTVVVNGVDVKPDSLAVAQHIAEQKAVGLQGNTKLEFRPSFANLLSEAGLSGVVETTAADVYEAIGFSEYVPSDNSKDPQEQEMRRKMKLAGMLSAEEFYKTIYENMPSGSVFVTGNMRRDSRQANFVINGLGWQGIIQRDTDSYLDILRDAGIPGEAINLFVPHQTESAGVYNLVAIVKQ